jgi:peptide chain release factor
VSVRVESERSQHANKRLASKLLAWRIRQIAQQDASCVRHQRRMQHYAVERGNPIRVFYGDAF